MSAARRARRDVSAARARGGASGPEIETGELTNTVPSCHCSGSCPLFALLPWLPEMLRKHTGRNFLVCESWPGVTFGGALVVDVLACAVELAEKGVLEKHVLL